MDIRRFFPAVIAAASLLPAPAAFALFGSTPVIASGKIVSQPRNVADFTGLSLELPGKALVRQGPTPSVVVEADDNLVAEIETVVERGSLAVRFKRPLSIVNRASIRIHVTGPVFESLAVSGSGDIAAESIRTRTLSVSIAGSGDMSIARLESDALKVSIGGSGDFTAAGRTGDLKANIAGSGDIHAAKLECGQASVSIAGSGDAVLWATGSLTVSIAGSGGVRYHGDPAVTKSVAGSGTVKRLGPAP